ncbi:MAG: hypothetical protein KC434_12385 [Anaerolineales bacterium]|nr:hypothetical protein [Anaerolineales bacterium]
MIEIKLTLTLRSPLNIGSGAQQGTLAQRGMLKERDGWPYVPATLLKGRLRHYVEQVASTLPHNTVRNPHDLTIINMDEHDPVSALFGTPWQQSLLMFEDLPLTGPPALMQWRQDKNRLPPRSTQRTSVSLNRRRRVAADQRLFNTELLLPGTPMMFGGAIRGQIEPWQAGLLVAGLRLIPAYGRGKSGGLGWVAVETQVMNGTEEWSDATMLAALKEVPHEQPV